MKEALELIQLVFTPVITGMLIGYFILKITKKI